MSSNATTPPMTPPATAPVLLPPPEGAGLGATCGDGCKSGGGGDVPPAWAVTCAASLLGGGGEEKLTGGGDEESGGGGVSIAAAPARAFGPPEGDNVGFEAQCTRDVICNSVNTRTAEEVVAMVAHSVDPDRVTPLTFSSRAPLSPNGKPGAMASRVPALPSVA